MRSLWPQPDSVGGQSAAHDLDDVDLERIYAYPHGLTAPWVQVNFVSSADGAATAGGRSSGLSSPGDQRIFRLGRDLADVVLVGAGTAQVEGYRGVTRTEVRAERRSRLGLPPVPPIAVVTGRCSIEPGSPLITDALVPTIVLTSAGAPRHRRAALSDAGADVVVAGEDRVALPSALAALADRGLLRVCCEGGPQLFGELIAEDLVDQLCLTVAPLLAGGDAARIAHSYRAHALRHLSLASVLTEASSVMLRYQRTNRATMDLSDTP